MFGAMLEAPSDTVMAKSHSDERLGDVILGAIPYWKTELAISAGAAAS